MWKNELVNRRRTKNQFGVLRNRKCDCNKNKQKHLNLPQLTASYAYVSGSCRASRFPCCQCQSALACGVDFWPPHHTAGTHSVPCGFDQNSRPKSNQNKRIIGWQITVAADWTRITRTHAPTNTAEAVRPCCEQRYTNTQTHTHTRNCISKTVLLQISVLQPETPRPPLLLLWTAAIRKLISLAYSSLLFCFKPGNMYTNTRQHTNRDTPTHSHTNTQYVNYMKKQWMRSV